MPHVLHALFKDRREEETAVQELEAAGVPREQYRLIVDDGSTRLRSLDVAETDSRGGFLAGAVAGVVGGTIMGLILGRVFAVSLPVAIGSGIALGLVVSLLAGWLGGFTLPNPKLDHLKEEQHPGNVLVTVEFDADDLCDTIAGVLRRHGTVERAESLR